MKLEGLIGFGDGPTVVLLNEVDGPAKSASIRGLRSKLDHLVKIGERAVIVAPLKVSQAATGEYLGEISAFQALRF
jgi:hypothetical protein